MSTQKSTFKRILLKISGEAFLGKQSFGIDPQACSSLASCFTNICAQNVQLGIVVGGGNIFRGVRLDSLGMQRTPADHMGMLGTLLNGIALQQALLAQNTPVSLMSALECPNVAESYNWAKALDHLQQNRIVIFVGGTGNPYFTTDTAAALRASEIGAHAFVKATKVEGVFDCDPLKDSHAYKYEAISYGEVLAKKLQIMDATAVALCQTNHIPIFVCSMHRLTTEPFLQILQNPHAGTWIKEQNIVD